MKRGNTIQDGSHRARLWSVWADAILADPIDKEELLDLASVAARVNTHALIQLCTKKDPPPERFISVKEAVTVSGLSEWTIRSLIRQGRLKPVPCGENAKRNARLRLSEVRGLGE